MVWLVLLAGSLLTEAHEDILISLSLSLPVSIFVREWGVCPTRKPLRFVHSSVCGAVCEFSRSVTHFYISASFFPLLPSHPCMLGHMGMGVREYAGAKFADVWVWRSSVLGQHLHILGLWRLVSMAWREDEGVGLARIGFLGCGGFLGYIFHICGVCCIVPREVFDAYTSSTFTC